MDKRSLYFQSIARYFFEQRGAPFVLSSMDVVQIAEWEKEGIPLRVVQEGIREAFEDHRRKPGPKRKIPSLSYCRKGVLKAFRSYKDRRVGRKPDRSPPADRCLKVRDAARDFLARIPESFEGLRPYYEEALEILSVAPTDEAVLEGLDGAVETFLIHHASDKIFEEVSREVREERELGSGLEFDRVVGIEVVKKIRDRYKIPFLSLFYY